MNKIRLAKKLKKNSKLLSKVKLCLLKTKSKEKCEQNQCFQLIVNTTEKCFWICGAIFNYSTKRNLASRCKIW